MKPLLRSASLLALLASAPLLTAQTVMTWGPNGSGIPLGGSGTWNTSLAFWTQNYGAGYQAWASAGNKQAIFAGNPGTVTFGAALQASRLTFDSSGYVLNGANNALTMVNDPFGFGPKITVTNPGDVATINARISGNRGLSVGGLGTLVLTSSNNFTAGSNGIRISGATLKLMAATGSLAPTNELIFGNNIEGWGGGGTFVLDNTGATGAATRSFAGLYTIMGDVTIQTDRVAAQNVSLTFTGVHNRYADSTINYVVNGGVNGTSNKINFSSQAAGFLDHGAYFNGSNFAWKDSGGYIRAINYGVDAGSVSTSGTTSAASTAHLQVTGPVTAQTSATFTSLKLSGSSPFSIVASNTVTASGILKTGGNASVLEGGTIRTGTSQELIVRTDLATDSLTIGSVIADSASGTSSLTKSGAGTLILTGSNTFTGQTQLNGGVLSVSTFPSGSEASPIGMGILHFSRGALLYTGSSSVTSTHSIHVNVGGGRFNVEQAGATVDLNSDVTAEIDNSSDSLAKYGPGTLILSGSSNNSSLAVSVYSGTLVLAKASEEFLSATYTLSIQSGVARLDGTGGNQIADDRTVTVNGSGIFDFNGRDEMFNLLNGSGLVTNNSSSANSIITLGKAFNSDANERGVFSGIIADGSGGQNVSLIKVGLGTQILSGANTFTGTISIQGGSLQIGNGGSTGSLVSNVHTGFTGETGTLAFNRTGASTYSGTISGDGDLRHIGTGTLTLAAANTFTGTTTISAGTLRLGSAGSGAFSPLGTSFAGTFVTSGGALDLNGFTLATAEPLSLIGSGAGSGALVNFSATSATYSGIVTLGTGGATIGGTGNITLSSALANNANALTKAGSNTLTLSANSSRTGAATVTGGVLRLQTATALGTSAVGLTLSGGNLALANDTATTFGAYATTISAPATITSDRVTAGTGLTHSLGSLAIGAQTLTIAPGSGVTSGTAGISFGATTLSANGAEFSPAAGAQLTLASLTGTNRSFTVSGSGNTTISGTISVGTGSLTKNGAGALTLSGSNSYSGGTMVNSGTVRIGHDRALGTGDVTVNAGTLEIQTGFTATNRITLSGGSLARSLNAGSNLANAVDATSSFSGGASDTNARLLAGTTSGATSIAVSFSDESEATNDQIRTSDVLHLSGIPTVGGSTTDVFVLQLSMTSVEPGSFLGWLNGADEWVNAALGNTGNSASGAQLGYNGTFANFQLTYGNTLSSYIGAWGFTGTTVWAVLNHNSDFGVVPEPATVILVLGGAALLLGHRRRSTGAFRSYTGSGDAAPGPSTVSHLRTCQREITPSTT